MICFTHVLLICS